MMDFFSQIIDFLIIVADIISNIFTSLLMVVSQIPRWLAFTNILFGYLPPLLLPFALFGILLSVLFLFLGRN